MIIEESYPSIPNSKIGTHNFKIDPRPVFNGDELLILVKPVEIIRYCIECPYCRGTGYL